MKSYHDLVRGFRNYSPSAWALIVANTVPLFGVMFLGWNALELIALYWIENVIIGVINVLKMIACAPNPAEIDWSSFGSDKDVAALKTQLKGLTGATGQFAHRGSKLFLVPFFIVHYGIFCLAHGMFILVMFSFQQQGTGRGHGVSAILNGPDAAFLGWAAAGLAVSHLYSFIRNYLGRGEYRRTVATLQMLQPYARVVVLHLAILFGAFITLVLDSNLGVLVILIVGKTALDLALHLRERERSAERARPTLPENILHEDPRQ